MAVLRMMDAIPTGPVSPEGFCFADLTHPPMRGSL
jgi:hypothetical protein